MEDTRLHALWSKYNKYIESLCPTLDYQCAACGIPYTRAWDALVDFLAAVFQVKRAPTRADIKTGRDNMDNHACPIKKLTITIAIKRAKRKITVLKSRENKVTFMAYYC